MISAIDPTKPADGISAVKADLRNDLQAVEALRTGKSDLGHGHTLSVITDADALAGLDQVDTAELPGAAVTVAKIAADAVGADQFQDRIPMNMQDQQLTRPQLTDFSEISSMPAISAGTLTFDLESGNVFEVVSTEDVTSLILVNLPAAGSAGAATLIFRRDATGGRTVVWPGPVLCSGSLPIAISLMAALDVYAFNVLGGGRQWFDFRGERASS